jgi:hypothetical protein
MLNCYDQRILCHTCVLALQAHNRKQGLPSANPQFNANPLRMTSHVHLARPTICKSAIQCKSFEGRRQHSFCEKNLHVGGFSHLQLVTFMFPALHPNVDFSNRSVSITPAAVGACSPASAKASWILGMSKLRMLCPAHTRPANKLQHPQEGQFSLLSQAIFFATVISELLLCLKNCHPLSLLHPSLTHSL